jgi:hypothetical protein
MLYLYTDVTSFDRRLPSLRSKNVAAGRITQTTARDPPIIPSSNHQSVAPTRSPSATLAPKENFMILPDLNMHAHTILYITAFTISMVYALQ